MEVINYYALTDDELNKKIETINDWLVHYKKDKRRKKALFAFKIALAAKELRQGRPDDFTQQVLDIFT